MGIGLVMLAAPSAIEGPVILPISPGHALSVLDAVAVLPLLAGSFSLYRGLWQRRGSLRAVALSMPGRAGALVLAGGFGLGLLIAAAFSAFFWWWAVGAVLFGAALLAAVVEASKAGNVTRGVEVRDRKTEEPS
jgi:hypothetical protein